MRLPRPSIRLRLTAWYATIFIAMGTILLAVSYAVVRHEFRDEQGKHFDPHLVDLMFESLDDIVAIRDLYRD